MKIRIYGNSVRFRLSRTEVDRFCASGQLQDQTEFGNTTFRYTLEQSTDIDDLDASFIDNKITMFVPAKFASGWDKNQVVGCSRTKTINEGKTLFLLLEKDFKCIDNTGMEDQSDNFENPLHTC